MRVWIVYETVTFSNERALLRLEAVRIFGKRRDSQNNPQKNAMKKTTLLAFAAFTALSMTSAFGQGMMKGGGMMKGQMSGKMSSTMMKMMMGLTAAEKKTAMHMMSKMTMSEKSAMEMSAKECMMMGMKGMKMSGMSDAQMHEHMMMGMSKSQKMSMMSAMKKMSPAEMAVAKKMMMNCYKMGMMHKKPMMKKM
ncbi:hypothetical protein BH11ARM2_BH11ARM2_00310 [soil metagenome]